MDGDINTTKDLSKTVNLLLSLCHYSLGVTDLEDVSSKLSSGVDWELFGELAHHHRLESLLNHTSEKLGPNFFPSVTADQIKQTHRENTKITLGLTSRLIKITKTFEDNNIPFLVIKGLAIEDWLYHNLGLRSSGDIDLFIDVNMVDAAVHCLRRLGYEMAYLNDRLEPRTKFFKQFLRAQKDIVFVHGTTQTVAELHWKLDISQSFFPLSFDEAWKTRKTIEIAGIETRTFADDYHAVYLCQHGSKHYWKNLFWLYDIAKLVLKPETDWDSILSCTRQLGAEASVGLALVLASRVFLAPVPVVFSREQDIIVAGNRLADELYCKILADQPDWSRLNWETMQTIRENIRWTSQIHPSKHRHLVEWLQYLFSPQMHDWESLKLPDSLTPLYRVWRPFRQLYKSLGLS